MGTKVDDRSYFISYSSGWQNIGGTSKAHESSIHATSSIGATATITFTGTAIRVYGTNPASNVGGEIVIDFILDDVPQRWVKGTHGISYYQDRFWDSGSLEDKKHTLVVKNMGNTAPVHFDYFEVWGSAITPVAPVTSSKKSELTTKPPINPGEGSTSVKVVVSTSVKIVTSTEPGGRPVTITVTPSTEPSSTFSGRSSLQSNNLNSPSQSSILDSIGSDINGPKASETALRTSTDTIGNGNGMVLDPTEYPDAASGAKSSRINTGAIVGAVVGGIIFCLIIGIVGALLYRRRRRLLLQAGHDNNPIVQPFNSGVTARASSGSGAFQRLGDTEYGVSNTSLLSTTPPFNPLQLSHTVNEKADPFFNPSDIAPAAGSSVSDHPSPVVSDSTRPVSNSNYSYFSSAEAPPPAYSSNRQSSMYASAYTTFPPPP